MMYYYYEPAEAKNFLKLAKEKSHCIVELTGLLQFSINNICIPEESCKRQKHMMFNIVLN